MLLCEIISEIAVHDGTAPKWFLQGKPIKNFSEIEDYLEGDEFDWDWRLCHVPLSAIENDPAPDILDHNRLKYQRDINKPIPPVILGIKPDRIQVYDGWHRITIARERATAYITAYVGKPR